MSISQYDNIIDSREVIERLEEMRDERQSLIDDVEAAEENVRFHHNGEIDESGDAPEHIELNECRERLENWDADNADDLAALESFAEEGENYAEDWQHGATLIAESYFVEYCKELVSDIGDIPREIPSYIEIDWDKTADNLRVDYTEIEWDGNTFLVR